MDEIISIIFSLQVWVTLFLGVIVNALVKHMPPLARGYLKKRRLKYLKKLRRVRVNPLEVQYEIAKAHSYLIFFLLTCFMYLIFLIQGPMDKTVEQSWLLFFILISPLYVVEFFWLLQDNYAKKLVKVSRYRHVKRKSDSNL